MTSQLPVTPLKTWISSASPRRGVLLSTYRAPSVRHIPVRLFPRQKSEGGSMTKRSKGRSRSPRAPSRRTRRRRRAGRNQMRRAYDDDPLAFVDTLMKRFGEAGGREAFLKFVAERPDRVGWDLFPSRRQSEWSRWPPLPQVPLEWW